MIVHLYLLQIFMFLLYEPDSLEFIDFKVNNYQLSYYLKYLFIYHGQQTHILFVLNYYEIVQISYVFITKM